MDSALCDALCSDPALRTSLEALTAAWRAEGDTRRGEATTGATAIPRTWPEDLEGNWAEVMAVELAWWVDLGCLKMVHSINHFREDLRSVLFPN